MNLVSYVITILLFVGPVILAVLGWPVEGDFKVVHLYPSYYILLIVLFLQYLKGNLNTDRCKYAVWIILIIFMFFLVNKIIGRDPSKMILFNSMVLPAMYYLFYEVLERNNFNRVIIRNIILFLFAFNGVLAVYERMTMSLFFPFDIIRSDFNLDLVQNSSIFRSAALLGLPLTNAVLMSIIMVFILISDMRPITKYSLYLLGFFSLFCFNARGAIMLSVATFVFYILRPIFKKGTSAGKRLFYCVLLVSFFLFGFYLLNAGYGGRFEEQGDFSQDNSTLARIQVWDIFNQYGVSNLLWGMYGDEAESIAYSVMGITHIENWFILSAMIAGLVITVIIVSLFIPVYRKATQYYDRFSSFLIFIIVIVLSSTNNSLACGVPSLSFYFACCYAFRPCQKEEMIKDENNGQ